MSALWTSPAATSLLRMLISPSTCRGSTRLIVTYDTTRLRKVDAGAQNVSTKRAKFIAASDACSAKRKHFGDKNMIRLTDPAHSLSGEVISLHRKIL